MLILPRQPLDTIDDLRKALQNAIALELSTIPPYLTALFSIKPGANAQAGAIVRSVVIEEMLHMSLACNILNAVGGQPDIPGALVVYPSQLPMDIGSEPGKPFVVSLSRLSEPTIDTFLTIEEPDQPLEFPVEPSMLGLDPSYHTIGDFYRAVGDLIVQLGPGIFTGPKERQVTGWIGPDELCAVTDEASALTAIELIIDQGEGTTQSPEAGDELAHYYRFEQIKTHLTLNRDPAIPQGYEWGAPPVPLDDNGVWPMLDNPPEIPLPAGSEVAYRSDQLDWTFTQLINELQRTFGGTPDAFGPAVAQMHALRIEAAALMPLEIPGTGGGTAGPRFLYVA